MHCDVHFAFLAKRVLPKWEKRRSRVAQTTDDFKRAASAGHHSGVVFSGPPPPPFFFGRSGAAASAALMPCPPPLRDDTKASMQPPNSMRLRTAQPIRLPTLPRFWHATATAGLS